MRKFATAIAVGASLSVTVLAAADPLELQPEAQAYLHFAFDGARDPARGFYYGLRLDRHPDAAAQQQSALAKIEFSSRGVTEASLNGLPFMRHVRLNQDEDGGEYETSGDESDSGDSGDTGEGGGDTVYGFADWGLVLVGAVGIGFAIAEVADTDESPDPPPATTGGNTGTSTGGDTGGTCIPGTPLCLPLTGGDGTSPANVPSAEYQAWLDGGTGHMGDLVAH